jgi:lysozyme
VTAVFLAIVAALAAGHFLYARGVLRFNHPSLARYPVRGIDVSHHQGAVDWAAVRASGIDFAFIKASEGADHLDREFARNWANARAAGVARGAYHFFTFCKPGRAQAENFVSAVGDSFGELPPAADVEFVGNCTKSQGAAFVRRELHEFLGAVERASGRRPALYFTGAARARILEAEFDDYAAWPRSLWGEPSRATAPRWDFWQFADNVRVPGVRTLVDMNVFRGSRAEFALLAQAHDTLAPP